MPTTKADLPGTLKRSPKKAQETWAKTHDSAVDYPPHVEVAGSGRDGVTDLDRTLGDRLPLDLLAAGSLDRPGDPRSHPQVVVGRVRDRVHVELRDVTVDDFELHSEMIARRVDRPRRYRKETQWAASRK